MNPKEVTSLFDRHFIVGFLAPVFFWLAVLKLALGARFLPKVVEPETGTAFLYVGATSLLVALLLSGVERQASRLLMGHYRVPLLTKRLLTRARINYAKTKAIADAPNLSTERTRARRRLDEQFPADPKNLLPTRYGNAVRATRDYYRTRWGLREHAVRWRILLLMSDYESNVRAEARAARSFFINGSIGAALAGLTLVVDGIIEHPHHAALAWIYVVPFLLMYILYLGAAHAAVRLGHTERAAVDLHRLELYERLGLAKLPDTEKLAPDPYAPHVSNFLLRGPPREESAEETIPPTG